MAYESTPDMVIVSSKIRGTSKADSFDTSLWRGITYMQTNAGSWRDLVPSIVQYDVDVHCVCALLMYTLCVLLIEWIAQEVERVHTCTVLL
jgi:hypothetical protein